MTDLRAKQLPAAVRDLIVLLSQISYGFVEDLVVVGGRPVLDPAPRIVREIKLKADPSPPERHLRGDFVLKDQMIELIRQLELVGDGVIERIEVRGGLPFRLVIEERPNRRCSDANDG